MNFRSIPLKAAGAAGIMALMCGHAAQADTVIRCGEDTDCLRQQHAAHPVKDVNYMRAFQAMPLNKRVLVAPVKLIDYLNLDNKLQGFPNQPRAAKPARQLLQDLTDAIEEIPAAVKTLVDARLMGIFLVEDLGGTGYTDYVYDQQHVPAGAFIVLDAGVLTRVANTWATWKENTPFIDDPAIELRATIENETEDNRKQALQYILLHEMGHVVSVGGNFHPRWDAWDCVNDPPDRYPFFQLSWQLKDSQGCEVVSKFDHEGFSYRADLVYYFGAKLPAAVSPEVYAQLERTNFPSLYAATFPGDDFAESFVTYVHTVLMGKPFGISIDKSGERQTTFRSCWNTARCAEKQKIISGLISPPQP